MTEDLLTVQEAAEALSVSAPRLRRLLTRPEWSQRTETRTRQTRTGTRTGTVLNRSLLPELRKALNSVGAPVDGEGKPAEVRTSDTEREREQDATETGTRTRTVRNENGNESNGSGADPDGSDWRARALVAEAEKEGLIARLADTASDRDAWKAQAQEAMELARAAQDEARAARLIGGRGPVQIEAGEVSQKRDTKKGEPAPVEHGADEPTVQHRGFLSFLRRWW